MRVPGLNGGTAIVKIAGLDLSSSNRKTGAMVQVFAFPESWAGIGFLRDKDEHVVCGSCPMMANL